MDVLGSVFITKSACGKSFAWNVRASTMTRASNKGISEWWKITGNGQKNVPKNDMKQPPLVDESVVSGMTLSNGIHCLQAFLARSVIINNRGEEMYTGQVNSLSQSNAS